MTRDEHILDDKTIEKICNQLSNDPEALARVLWYIGKEERAYSDGGRPGPAVQVLQQLTQNANTVTAFKNYLERIVEDTKGEETGGGNGGGSNFSDTMKLIHDTMLASSQPNGGGGGGGNGHGKNLIELNSATTTALLMGFCAGFGRVPPAAQAAILHLASQVTVLNQASQALVSSGVLSVVRQGHGSLVVVALAAVYLSYEALQSINAWWRGEISGRRCAKAIVDSACGIVAGAAAGVGGAALGSLLLGPAGAVAGGVLGSVIGSQVAAALVDHLTTRLLDLPRDVAVERAYAYFGLTHHASTAEVNAAYRRMALLAHPDKGGREGHFAEVQAHLAVIKKARGAQL